MMSPFLENFKAQLQANKAKSALLGVVTCLGAFLLIRNFATPNPHTAAALPTARVAQVSSDGSDSDVPALSPKELEERIAQSKALWLVLREKRGVAPQSAFAFDAAYYSLDPAARPVAPPEPTGPQVVAVQPEKSVPKTADVPDEHARERAVREQARSLVLQSTVLGAVPIAVINTGVLHLNDHVGGFRIVAIRARQVTVEKDGITLAVEMAK